MNRRTETVCVRGSQSRKAVDNTGSISFPIYQTAAFAHPGIAQSTGYDYSRLQNPTREEVERVVADLEKGLDALAFATGMAAVSTMMEMFVPGDHLIATEDLYGGTTRLFQHISVKNGIEVSFTDTSQISNIRAAVRENTRAVFLETPTNPMMKITDIAAVAALAKENGFILIVDNTFLSPYFQNPLTLGADIVLHSGTKYLGGHNDTLAGFLVTDKADILEKLRFIYKTIGGGLSPLDSWLILRGIKTLALRMERHQENAVRVAAFLKTHPKVKEVYYIGREDHPDKEIINKQCKGYGGMVSFRVDSEVTARQILERVRLIYFAESLGGTESLITYPMLQTHADVPEAARRALGVDETLLRMSVGIEHHEDIIADLKQAMG